MLSTKKMMTTTLVGAAILMASSLATISPASAARGWHGGHGGWVGPAIGFGAGVAVGNALAAPYYDYGPDYGYEDGPGPYAYGPPADDYGAGPYPYRPPAYAYNNGDADAYCASRFRTYDPYSHTYMGYDGFRHHCP